MKKLITIDLFESVVISKDLIQEEANMNFKRDLTEEEFEMVIDTIEENLLDFVFSNICEALDSK